MSLAVNYSAASDAARPVAPPEAPRVSVVVPCRNEARSVERLLDALRAQDWRVHEVVVVDDGSNDGTPGVVHDYGLRYPEFPLRLIASHGVGIPAAVNAGAGAASGDVLIRLDAHSCPAPDYVRWSVQALDAENAGVTGGVWEIAPGAATLRARAIARAVAHPMGAGDAAYRTGRTLAHAEDVDTVPFGCFRKALWQEVGGLNERLLTNEDYEFNYRVRRSGRRVVLDPRVRSTYFARTTLRALAHQYFRYGWWKAEMLKDNPASLRWRQAVPVAFVGTCWLLAAGAPFLPAVRWLLAGFLAVYLLALGAASTQICGGRRTWRILPFLPAAFAAIHFAWGTGVLVNLVTFGRWPARQAPSLSAGSA
jgi:succinoglycan biosynthesis protein ExoA